jgi:hypothetical protein
MPTTSELSEMVFLLPNSGVFDDTTRHARLQAESKQRINDTRALRGKLLKKT